MAIDTELAMLRTDITSVELLAMLQEPQGQLSGRCSFDAMSYLTSPPLRSHLQAWLELLT